MNKLLILFVILIFGLKLSFSQDMNFNKVDFYKDSIVEIKHYEINNLKNNDTILLNHYFYDNYGYIIEKHYNYRRIESHLRYNDTGTMYWIYDTVGTIEKPSYTTIKYKYNKKGFLVKEEYINSERIYVLDGLYVVNTVVCETINYSQYGLYDAKKIISSKVLTYKDGSIETHYYKYKKDKLVQINIYQGEVLYKTKIYEYVFYSK